MSSLDREIIKEYEKYVEKIRTLLTRDLAKYCILIFITIVVLGLVTLNGFILCVGGSLTSTVVIAYLVPYPEASIKMSFNKDKCTVGDIVELLLEVESRSGIGIITINLGLPEELEIIEGRRVITIFKGLSRLNIRYIIRIRATKIGIYRIYYPTVESWNIISIRGCRVYKFDNYIILQVIPRALAIKTRFRARVRTTRLPPVILTRLRIGPASTEFREIRKYVPGDPVKYINWKATARLGQDTPLVNEFERESISRILIVPDLSTRTLIEGMDIYGHEEIISTTLSLTRTLLRSGCQVEILDPYTSKIFKIHYTRLHFYRIVDHFVKYRQVYSYSHDIFSTEIMDKLIRESKNIDFVILITNVDFTNIDKIINLAKELYRKYRVRLTVIDIDSSKILEKIDPLSGYCVEMYRVLKRYIRSYLSRSGVRVFRHVLGTSIRKIVSDIICQAL